MNFKLCLVGHLNYIDDLETIIHHNFFNIEVYKVVFNTDVDIKLAISEIEKNIKYCDAILYTGIEPFLLISQRINNSISSSYVLIKKQDLVHCLLKSSYKFDFDIYNISIDSMDYNSIVETYNSLSLDISNLSINIVEIKTKEHNFVYKAEQEHFKNYKNKLSSICITSITEIYNNLSKNNIPCALLAPSMENYISEVKTLILRDKIKKTENNEISIITIKISQNNDFYVLNNNDLQEILEINIAAQYIAVFCQKLEGALYTISNNSKLSINTVYKINCIIKQSNKREFTANELALELGVTVRTANRIILKLEDAKYLKEVGKHIIESKGRPSRIVKILF